MSAIAAPARPTGVAALAVITGLLSFVGLLSIPGALLIAMFLPGPVQQLIQVDTFYRNWLLVASALGWTASIVAIGASIGLWFLHPWARRAMLAYAVYAIVMTFANAAVVLFVLFPALFAWEGPEKGGAIAGAGAGLAGSLVGMILPCAQLYVLTRPSIRSAFHDAS